MESIKEITQSTKAAQLKLAKNKFDAGIEKRKQSGKSQKQFDRIYSACLKAAEKGDTYISLDSIFWFWETLYPETITSLSEKGIRTYCDFQVYFSWKEEVSAFEKVLMKNGYFEETYAYRKIMRYS